MAREKEFFIGNYDHMDDFYERIDLLRSENLYNPERDNDRHLRDLIERRPGAIKVAKEIGERAWRLVGSVYIGDGIGVVAGLVVAKDARKQGIGGLLLDAAEEQLITEGHRQFELQIDEGQDELKEWYQKRGFTPRYIAVGLIKPLRLPDHQIIEEGEQQLTRQQVREAFLTLYFFERDSAKFEDKELGNKDNFSIETPGLKQLFKESAIPALRDAFFLEDDLLCKLSITPWLSYSTEEQPQEEDHVVAWVKRFSEYFLYGHSKNKGIPKKIPNDRFLFMRPLEDVRNYGRLMYASTLDIYGEYVCYDQANDTIIPFAIDPNEGIVHMSDEEGASMIERMVACAEAYRLASRKQPSYILRRHA